MNLIYFRLLLHNITYYHLMPWHRSFYLLDHAVSAFFFFYFSFRCVRWLHFALFIGQLVCSEFGQVAVFATSCFFLSWSFLCLQPRNERCLFLDRQRFTLPNCNIIVTLFWYALFYFCHSLGLADDVSGDVRIQWSMVNRAAITINIKFDNHIKMRDNNNTRIFAMGPLVAIMRCNPTRW